MIPQDNFTPHGYLDNPYHSWKLNPGGVLRSRVPLGMGWHVPNLGSYARNQFQYTAHLTIGLKVGDLVLVTAEDFHRHGCSISSTVHTKNRFEYLCTIPSYHLALHVRYFLIQEHVLGCICSLTSSARQELPHITCFVMHTHTHNPETSRLWEHGWYACAGPESGSAMLGLASEGDVFTHGLHPADGMPVHIDEPILVVSLQDVSDWARGEQVLQPTVTQRQHDSGFQVRTLVLPCHLTLDDARDSESRTFNVVLARGVSQDESGQRWLEGIEEIARADAEHQADDMLFWRRAPQLAGDWPEHWRRGWIYDLETLRMVVRPSMGIITQSWDGMQIQAPRLVLAEAAMDMLFFSYANPELAADVILGHFESSSRPNLPCMREDGSYNMVADDGQICGTAPEWGFPVWCCDQIWLRTGDRHWLRHLYPHVAAYLRWWLERRCDDEGWLTYACSWESGQDVSSRFGPQQTGGTSIEHVRPVDLQASMALSAAILARWATLLAQEKSASDVTNYSAEKVHWQEIASRFTVKTRSMWQDDWFRDYDTLTGEWSNQQDTMHLAPMFCGVAGWNHTEQLTSYFKHPPQHSGWTPLCWPPVVLTLIGAAASAQKLEDAATLSFQFMDAAWRGADRREVDEQHGLPGVTREYLRSLPAGKWGEVNYTGAGIEGYGWGAIGIHLLLRYLMGLREHDEQTLMVAPMLPTVLRRPGAVYRVAPVQWGPYHLQVTCTVRTAQRYEVHITSAFWREEDDEPEVEQEWRWDGAWGEAKILRLREEQPADKKEAHSS